MQKSGQSTRDELFGGRRDIEIGEGEGRSAEAKLDEASQYQDKTEDAYKVRSGKWARGRGREWVKLCLVSGILIVVCDACCVGCEVQRISGVVRCGGVGPGLFRLFLCLVFGGDSEGWWWKVVVIV